MFQITCGILAFVCSLLLVTIKASAQDREVPKPFRSYNKVGINGHSLLVDPQLNFRMIKNDQKHEENFGWEFGDELIQVNCGKYSVEIGFSNGPSDDPNYEIIITSGKKVLTKNINAENLAVSSACHFYASGQSDNSFYMSQKFTITDKGIQETVQPFYLVNKICRTSNTATLTTERCGKGSTVASLPKGSEVQILASEWFKTDENGNKVGNCSTEKESYLVSTPFGLVGWVENKRGDVYEHPGEPLSCIVFHGD